ncbi:MAG: lysylphosphatidylglycerol synthase transmembrane domain-containing protein [Terriglobales bacterium]
MSRKRILISILLVAVAGLAVWQYRHSPEWRQFSWAAVWAATTAARGWDIAAAVGLIYTTYLLRTWRWQALMSPPGRFWPVLKGTVVGFTGTAFLGRPGELVRPYYIGRRHTGGLPPQLAVWVLERMLDMAAVVLLVGLALVFDPQLQQLTRDSGYARGFRKAGLIVSLGVAALVALLFYFHRRAPAILARLRQRNAAHPRAVRLRWEHFLQTLAEGTRGLGRARTLAAAVALTLTLWLVVSGAIWLVVRAYPEMLPGFGFSQGVVLMGLTAVGAVLQLPAVGGGYQVITIFGLTRLFGAATAPATSAALIMWMICFYAIAPFGAALAAHEGVSWRGMERAAGDFH